jgi:hypothetical protein
MRIVGKRAIEAEAAAGDAPEEEAVIGEEGEGGEAAEGGEE